MQTLTGVNLFEAFHQLDRQLPAHVYKRIQGGKGGKLRLTEIVATFLPDLLLELFGPIWPWLRISARRDDRVQDTKVERSHNSTQRKPQPTAAELLTSRFAMLQVPDLQLAHFRYVGEK